LPVPVPPHIRVGRPLGKPPPVTRPDRGYQSPPWEADEAAVQQFDFLFAIPKIRRSPFTHFAPGERHRSTEAPGGFKMALPALIDQGSQRAQP